MWPEPHPPNQPSGGHQPDQLSIKWIVGAGLALLLLVFLAIGVCYWGIVTWGNYFTERDPAEVWESVHTGVGVDPNQTLDRLKLQREQREWLGSYGWEDEEDNIARIPIDRAIDLMVERKLEVKFPETGDQASGKEEPGNDR